jgi:adenosylmethionine-8-amino-7-oxononanoate aminotransferase
VAKEFLRAARRGRSPHFRYIDGLVHHLSASYTYRRPEGMTETQFTDYLVDELQATIGEIGTKNIAAFIAEPITPARSGTNSCHRR